MTVAPDAADRIQALLSEEATAPPLSEFVNKSQLQAVVLGSSKDPNAKITILLVAPGRPRPLLAIKVPTTDLAASVVQAEGRVLPELAEIAPQVSATVPRKLGMIEFHGRLGLVMTAVAGTPMMRSYVSRGHTASASRVARDFSAAGRWVAALQRASAAERAPIDMDGGVAARLEMRFGDEERIVDDLERLAAIHARLARTTTPRTVVHGDFWFGNVLLADGAASGVVDWESGETSGEPVRDLVRFVLAYALFLDRGTKPGRRVAGHPQLRAGTWGAAVDYALHGSGWFPEIVRRFLQDGLTRLGAAPDYWREAALAGVAELAALTDHPEFARRNLELFRRLARHGERVTRPARGLVLQP